MLFKDVRHHVNSQSFFVHKCFEVMRAVSNRETLYLISELCLLQCMLSNSVSLFGFMEQVTWLILIHQKCF